MSSNSELFPRAMSLAVHELRTPVTVVAGYLRMVLKEQAGPLSDMQRRMLEEAERSCGRINALVSEMSELGKLEDGRIEIGRAEFDLAAVITELASNMHEGSDRGIRLEVRGVDQPIMVTGDRPRIAAALQALMHAALRERSEPGVIVVDVTLTAAADRRWVTIAIGEEPVTHSLAAIADAGRPPFDEWRGGLGLALAVGRRVIEAHGGALWSAPDMPRAGSALRLPLTQDRS
jgi:signal transduction histidine kinase